MPQVDLETLVSACAGGGTDRKITCETLADTTAAEEQGLPGNDDDDDDLPVEDVPPDFPPESFWLSKDAELDWFDRNAFFERKESTKGISISTNSNHIPSSNSNSQRFSMNLKSKASIIGLPKTQKTNYIDCKRRNNKPANIQLFPKRSQSIGKSSVAVAEPSSPKVSCMGRVRSKRGRRRSTEHSRKKEKSVGRSRSDDHETRQKGLYSRVKSMFTGRRDKKTGRSQCDKIQLEETTVEEAPRKSAAPRMRQFPVGIEPTVEPPALGGMKKFASGRRSGSWSTDDFDVALSESLVDGPTKRS